MDWIENLGERYPCYARRCLWHTVLDRILYRVCNGMDNFVCSNEHCEHHDAYCRSDCPSVQGIVDLDFAKKFGVGKVGVCAVLWIVIKVIFYFESMID